jgi:uncharacterized membrane protein YcaP (DUF421 family)
MDAVLRAVVMYALLMVIFRLTGKRTLSQITTFDFILLLVVGEATQQALLGDDFSITVAILVIITLMLMDVGLDLLQQVFPRLERLMDDVPLVLVDEGQPIDRHLRKSRISPGDILEAAREKQGLERMDQIKYAVLERTGSISIIPKESGG